VTVGEWWARWFPAVDLAPSTLEAYAQQYRRHVEPRFARVRLDEITALDLSQFARSLREQGLAPSSVAVAMAVIRDLLVDAAGEGLITAAPTGVIRRRRAGRAGPVRAGVAAELGTVLAVRRRLPDQESLMALTAVFTGMRWGEVCGMRTGTLRLQPAGLGVGGGVYEIDAQLGAVHEDVHARRFFGPPKDGHGRVIDLPVFLADLLQALVEAVDGRTLVFANRHGEPIRHTDFLRRWRPACDGRSAQYGREGELRAPAEPPLHPRLRFHDLRHTHKTMLIELGVPEVLQDERLGHHPPGMRGVYAHTTRRMREELVDGLQELWEREQTR
jgi:integrase